MNMKRLLLSTMCLVLLLGNPAEAQRMLTIKPKQPVICYQSFDNRHDHVGVSEKFMRMRNNAQGRTKTATIEVEYINFPSDNLAKTAFQYAVDIWETELISDVPIRIRAEWRPLGAGVLGQAVWGSAHANFGGEPYTNVFYPVALAEKIAGRELNDPLEPDIFASFNSNASWYFGTDGNTPAGKMDLVTIVLHEIAHGLGFTDTYDVSGSQGTVGLPSGGMSVPFVFDLFVENDAGVRLITDFQSPSAGLATALQSSNVFFSSAGTMAVLNGERPKLYAPSSFDNGSSISHLDESTFNDPQDANRLMTPHIAFAESVHDPGSVLLAALADMGWVYTFIDHEPLRDTERMNGQPYPVKVKIRSDRGYDPGSVTLHYTSNGTDFVSVTMQPTGTAHEFQAALPGTTIQKAYAYYISVEDDEARSFTNPGISYAIGEEPEQGMHFFRIGPDSEAPEIVHEPVRFVSETGNLVLSATVTDNQDVEEVVVEYRVNDGAIQTEVMSKEDGDEYSANIDLPPVSHDDQIHYRLIATDVAASQNVTTSPEDGFYTVDVTGIMPVQESYFNNFNTLSSDFFGDNFSILTPEGFKNGAIHSNHPYPNGSGPTSRSHYTYQLQIPIRISSDNNPVIRFDEIVLVEPGENGSVFGDEGFYDYVVVEGSVDQGNTWEPFAPGYDARANNDWLARYNSSMSNDNSTANGDSTLFRKRVINMLENGKFSDGDEVLIRFRLFADPLANGWGWAIDNLEIQPPVTGIEDVLDFTIYPVPAGDEVFVELRSDDLAVSLLDAVGKEVYATHVEGANGPTRLMIDLRSFRYGLYFVRVHSSKGVAVKKFVKVKR